MIKDLILFVVLILIVLCSFYILIRNNKVYHFTVSLSNVLYGELKRILNTYKDDDEFHEDEKLFFNLKEKAQVLLDKNSYIKYLFSFKPLKIEKWFNKEELEFVEYLKQYRR